MGIQEQIRAKTELKLPAKFLSDHSRISGGVAHSLSTPKPQFSRLYAMQVESSEKPM